MSFGTFSYYILPLSMQSAIAKSAVGRSSLWISEYSYDHLVEAQMSDPCLGKLITWISTGEEPAQKHIFLYSPAVKYFFNCRNQSVKMVSCFTSGRKYLVIYFYSWFLRKK